MDNVLLCLRQQKLKAICSMNHRFYSITIWGHKNCSEYVQLSFFAFYKALKITVNIFQ